MQELFSKFPGETPNDLIVIYWVTIDGIEVSGPQVGENFSIARQRKQEEFQQFYKFFTIVPILKVVKIFRQLYKKS